MKDVHREMAELLRVATVGGARGCEALMQHSIESNVTVRRGKVDSEERLETSEWQLRVWGNRGACIVLRGSHGEVLSGVDDAIASANLKPEAPFDGPVERLPTSAAGLGTFDRRHASISGKDRSDLALSAERDARMADRRLLTRPFQYSDTLRTRVFRNSKGVNLEEKSTWYSLRGGVDVVSGSEQFSLVDSRMGRGFSDVSTLPLGKLLAARAQRLLKRGGRTEDKLPVILSPRATATIFECLAAQFTAEKLSEKQCFLFREGVRLSQCLNLLDDGASPGGIRTRSFDDRGVPSVPLTLLREGEVAGRMLSPEQARRHNTRPTGHCSGEALVPTNIILQQGTRSVNAVMTERGDRVYWIDDIDDMSGLCLDTGDLSCAVSGLVMRGSEVEGGFRNCTLSGNLGEALSSVQHVFSNTDRVRHVDAPAIMLEGFQLSSSTTTVQS